MEIVYHSNCADGIIARELFKIALFNKGFTEDVVENPYNYEPNFGHIEDGTCWVDCSPGTWEDFEQGLKNGCFYYDHHETKREFFDKAHELGYTDCIFGENKLNHSGAYLVYGSLRESLGHYEKLAWLAGVADTFRKDDPDFELARSLSQLVSLLGNNVSISNYAECDNMLKMAEDYKVKNKARAEMLARGAIIERIDKYKIAFVNDINVSDCSEILRSHHDVNIIVGWSLFNENGKDTISLSLRSDGTFNVREFAQKLGGGGHDKAAGCKIGLRKHCDVIQEVCSLIFRWRINGNPT